MNNAPTLLWFRNDLRISDNPALLAAAARGAPVLGLYILDTAGDRRPMGAASRWWLQHSLTRLGESLAALGSRLVVLEGDPETLLPATVAALGAKAVVWNRRYGAAERRLDGALKETLRGRGVSVESFNASLLREPWEVRSQAGAPMKVFTPFWKAARAQGPFAAPLAAPGPMPALGDLPPLPGQIDLADVFHLNAPVDWTLEMATTWQPGEAGAQARLAAFLSGGLRGYAEDRNRPDRTSTSFLSPHLAFGEIGPRQIIQTSTFAVESGESPAGTDDLTKFFSEVGWREFAYHLLYDNPDLAKTNIQRKFDAFPWQGDAAHLKAWQRGQTGYPIVDAGMRQLWQTGWMHNRVRMVVASFLIKHLLIDWRVGEDWFWDTLVDADPANNPASWQWVAGSGADAAPYYRIFNPMLQGVKFDPDGTYVRQFVPELESMPSAHIHAPWQAPPHILRQARVDLGRTYPRPIVDHDAARARALAAYKDMG